MKETFQMFAAYNRWANERIYDEAANLSAEEFSADKGAFFGSLQRTLNHILAADRIWMKRFTGAGDAPSRLDALLFADLAPLREARQAEDRRIIDWIAQTPEEGFSGTFTYVPVTTPEPVTQRLAPAVSHFFNHQTHHRGQCYTILTSLGRPSVMLDLVAFQRTEEGRPFA